MLHHNLNFQDHINTMLRKMSAGMRTIEIVRRTIPLKSRIAMLKALVLSHLQHSMNFLTSITEIQKKQIDKQIKWDMRVCVFKRKRETAFPREASHKNLPFELLLEKSCLLRFRQEFSCSLLHQKCRQMALHGPSKYRVVENLAGCA